MFNVYNLIYNFSKGIKVKKFHEVPSGTAVKIYGKDADDNLVEDDVPSGGSGELPEGTENQTLRHNGTDWEATDLSSFAGIVKSVKRVLTKNEILDLHNTPITLLDYSSDYAVKPLCCIVKPLTTCDYNEYFQLKDNNGKEIKTSGGIARRLNTLNIQDTLLHADTNVVNSIIVDDYGGGITDNGNSGDVAIILQYILFDLTSIPITEPLYELRFYFMNLTFYWNEVPNAIRYYLERSDDGINDFEVIYDGVVNEFQYTPDDGVGFYRVRARDEYDYAEYSDVIEQWYYETLPTPSNLQLDGTTLTWDLVHTATQYSIYRSVVNNGQPSADYSLQGKTYSEDATTFEVNLESGKRNYFRINTKNLSQYALPSEAIWVEV